MLDRSGNGGCRTCATCPVTDLTGWARRWRLSDAALAELLVLLAQPPGIHPDTKAPGSEAAAQAAIRLAAPHNRVTLWRNNNVAFVDESGVPVRAGLANDSAKLNRHIKSSDLIGLVPIEIQPWHVGRVLGAFVAIETKKPSWVYRHSDKRAVAQQRFLQLVRSAGGLGAFARDAGDFHNSLRVYLQGRG